MDIVEDNGEDMLYASLVVLQNQGTGEALENHNFLQCRFFQLNMKLEHDLLGVHFQSITSSEGFKVYFCSDGDVIFQWIDGQDDSDHKNTIINFISERFRKDIEAIMPFEDFFAEYNIFDNIGALKAECLKKQGKITKNGRELTRCLENDRLVSTFSSTIQLISMQRTMRVKPHILIVEDQAFSQQMLLSVLEPEHTCHVASSAGEGVLLYIEKCPDIVFLDIGLPDISGHSFAKLLKAIDPNVYVVLVTAKNFASDVQTAKENDVKGYIPKPFTKDAIFETLDKFNQNKRKRAS